MEQAQASSHHSKRSLNPNQCQPMELPQATVAINSRLMVLPLLSTHRKTLMVRYHLSSRLLQAMLPQQKLTQKAILLPHE